VTGTRAAPIGTHRPRSRPSSAARRSGYVVAALVNAVLLWLVHVWPGWDAVPFLDDDFREVLPWVDAAMWGGVVANALYVVRDPRWLIALGGAVTTAIGLGAAVALWQVFPFDLDGSEAWTVLVRIGLGLAIAGSVIAIVVDLVAFIRAIARREGNPS
jgi:hypothetical protein